MTPVVRILPWGPRAPGKLLELRGAIAGNRFVVNAWIEPIELERGHRWRLREKVRHAWREWDRQRAAAEPAPLGRCCFGRTWMGHTMYGRSRCSCDATCRIFSGVDGVAAFAGGYPTCDDHLGPVLVVVVERLRGVVDSGIPLDPAWKLTVHKDGRVLPIEMWKIRPDMPVEQMLGIIGERP